ncbi:MAG TPA: NAD-dependent epimerase/dehydratase family protein [Micromonosporaceae bacterium]
MVVGATGFLGTHVWRRAEAAGMEVVTAARSPLPDSPWHVLVDLAADDPGRLATTLAEVAPDAVVNCAGAVSGPAPRLAAVNITGTYTLVRAMARAAPLARLVHLGSAAEYGWSEPGVAVTERSPARPVGVYGVTKLAATQLVELARAAVPHAVVLRVFNPVGPGATTAGLPGRLVAELRTALAEGVEVRLGPLDAVRDFVDVRDVAEAALTAATAPTLPHPIVNIGSGRGVPVRTLVTHLTTLSGYHGRVCEDSAGSTRSADVPWQQADISLARADLGWRPRRDLVVSLADLWEATS